jgi:hypothetical protein
MYQPRAKLEFIKRYCSPKDGWHVCVDSDGSEKGKGGKRIKEHAQDRGLKMRTDWCDVERELRQLNVQIGSYAQWCKELEFEGFGRRPDVAAYHNDHGCIIAEVEAESTGQPGDKVYMAVGQILLAASLPSAKWKPSFLVVVHGEKMVAILLRMTRLIAIPIFGLSMCRDKRDDQLIIRPTSVRLPRSFASLL